MPNSYWLDHVGLVARNFDAAEKTFRRFGFDLTPRSRHSAPPSRGAPREPLGSSNCCAMLTQGYFEIAGLTDPDRPTWIYDLLARYEGLHVIAIGVDDIDRCYADLRSRDIDVPPPASLFRDIEIDGENHVVEFKHVRTNFDQFPEARFVFVQHATPHLLWRPNLLSHRNGALSLRDVQLGTDQFAATVKNLERLFGVTAGLEDDCVAHFPLARGALKVFSSAGLAKTYGELDFPRFPSVTGCRFGVASTREVRAFLGAAGVPVLGGGDTIWIGPKDANGMLMEFSAASEEA